MIIFQTAGSGDLGSLGLRRALAGAPVPATTFRNNAYIHRLNRTLQAEMRAVSAYRSSGDETGSAAFLDLAETGHQDSGKALVRLIIANRGIPEDRSALSLGLTRTFIQLCALMPPALTRRMTHGTLKQLEKSLIASYKKLLAAAPNRDVHVLEELLDKSERLACTLAATNGE
jgi:hypothetical protein